MKFYLESNSETYMFSKLSNNFFDKKYDCCRWNVNLMIVKVEISIQKATLGYKVVTVTIV